MLAADLEAGTTYNFEPAMSPRRSRSRSREQERARRSAIRFLGTNGDKFKFEKVEIRGTCGPDACKGKIFLSERSLQYLAQHSYMEQADVDPDTATKTG